MKDINLALDEQLNGNAGISIFWENVNNEPVIGTPFCRPSFMPNTPNDQWDLGAGSDWKTGIYRIDLFYPLGEGHGAVNTKSDTILAAFSQGTKLTKNTTVVAIKSAGRLQGRASGAWYHVPLEIIWESFI